MDNNLDTHFVSEGSIKLGKVILPYQSSDSEELCLEVGEWIDVLEEYKSTGWALGRKSQSKEKGRLPLNFVEVLGSQPVAISDEEFTGKGNCLCEMFDC